MYVQRLRGYFKDGNAIHQAQYGDTITYDIPGHAPGQIYLSQMINGRTTYTGAFTIPMAPHLLTTDDEAGQWINKAYEWNPPQGPGGVLLETSTLMVNPGTSSTGTPTMPPANAPLATCPPGLVPYPAYIDVNGNFMTSGCTYPPGQQPSAPPPAPKPLPTVVTCPPGAVLQSDGTCLATVTTTTTLTPGAGTVPPEPMPPTPIPTAPADNSMWWLAGAAAAVYFLLKKK